MLKPFPKKVIARLIVQFEADQPAFVANGKIINAGNSHTPAVTGPSAV